MILLKDIRDYVATLGITEDAHCYCGKMADKKEKSIGIYPSKQRQPARMPIGGKESASYGVKGISLLVHWDKSPTESEQAAIALQEALISCREIQVNGHTIKFIDLAYDEPIPVDTDDNGIYEYVIECLFYYERKR